MAGTQGVTRIRPRAVINNPATSCAVICLPTEQTGLFPDQRSSSMMLRSNTGRGGDGQSHRRFGYLRLLDVNHDVVYRRTERRDRVRIATPPRRESEGRAHRSCRGNGASERRIYRLLRYKSGASSRRPTAKASGSAGTRILGPTDRLAASRTAQRRRCMARYRWGRRKRRKRYNAPLESCSGSGRRFVSRIRYWSKSAVRSHR